MCVGNGPTAGQRFDRLLRAVALQPRPEVTEFGSDAPAAAVEHAVDDQRAADAAPDVAVEDDLLSPAGAELRFAETGQVGIVAQDGRHTQRLLTPSGEVKIVPAVDLLIDNV